MGYPAKKSHPAANAPRAMAVAPSMYSFGIVFFAPLQNLCHRTAVVSDGRF
jgi:hypothetical protein